MPFPNLQGKQAGRPYVTARQLPDPVLTGRLRAALPAAAYGPSWTTDAPYRETAEEIAKYRAEAILAVEMEASCLFTVAKATGTAAAAAFVVSDVLRGERWDPLFGSANVLRGLWALFEAAETCLRLLPPPDISAVPTTPGAALYRVAG
jgi:hypothetical protein